MKSFDEICSDKRVLKIWKRIEMDKILKLKITVRSTKQSDKALVHVTKMKGWEHVSVSFTNKIPSWECMQEMKELCFYDDEECFQIHPKADNYVNNNEFTLHIWRPEEGMTQIPPSIMVGIRPNHIEEDAQAIKEMLTETYEAPSDEELELMKLMATPEGMEQVRERLKHDQAMVLQLSKQLGII